MLIIADRCGGLCNRLWTFANVVAWGLEHRRSVISLGFDKFAPHFPGLATRWGVTGRVEPGDRQAAVGLLMPRAAWRLGFKVNLRTHNIPHLALADHESLDLESTPVVQKLAEARLAFLTGLYHLARGSLERRSDEIRQLFRPDEAARAAAEGVLSKAREKADVIVGVHIRHGDYRTFCEGLMFYSTEEYADLMRHLTSLWPGKAVAFVVCSDEAQPAATFEGLRVHDGPGDRYGDLHSLALCDYLVGPSSTFSRWASFWGRTPLWMMDWRAVERTGGPVQRCPRPEDFSVATSSSHQVEQGTLRLWGPT